MHAAELPPRKDRVGRTPPRPTAAGGGAHRERLREALFTLLDPTAKRAGQRRGDPLRVRIAGAVLAATLLAGCGPSGAGQVPAIGQVTLDGAPLGGVYVTFRPDDGEPGRGGFAEADAEGRFEIAYPDTGSGLVPGRYRVTIATPPDAASASRGPAPALNGPAVGSAPYPNVYSSPENTPLRVVVAPGGAPLAVELFKNPPKPQ